MRTLSGRSFRTVVSAALFVAPLSAQSMQDLVGYTDLQDRLGANTPTGAGVYLGQVEDVDVVGWAPDVNDPEFIGKTFIFRSANPGVSVHATFVGKFCYGDTVGLAPGITSIDGYESGGWQGLDFLNESTSLPPHLVPVKIFNNSWVGSSAVANDELRRLDYAVNTQGLVLCNAVNNSQGPLDVLLAYAFNCIEVGRSDGQHRSGDTGPGFDGPGRMKPLIVAPQGATSFATPLVSAGAALLIETARTNPWLAMDPNSMRPDVVRAVLMAGALHRSGWSNNAVPSGPMRGTTTTPLDTLYGADQLNVNHSHWILTGLEQLPAPTVAQATTATHAGWALADTHAGSSLWWRFSVESKKPYASIIAAWNRSVAADFQSWSIPNVDLQLWRLDPLNGQTTLVGNPGLPYYVAGNVQSTSPDDNVEHLLVHSLMPGNYLLELHRTADALPPWQVAVAWEFAAQPAVQYCVGKVNSFGLTADLSPHGFPNVSANQFELRVRDAIPNQFGVVFSGPARAFRPFMGGTLCVKPPLVRLPVVTIDGQGHATIPVPLVPSMIGTKRSYQFLYRDLNDPAGFGVGLSNAVEVPFSY